MACLHHTVSARSRDGARIHVHVCLTLEPTFSTPPSISPTPLVIIKCFLAELPPWGLTDHLPSEMLLGKGVPWSRSLGTLYSFPHFGHLEGHQHRKVSEQASSKVTCPTLLNPAFLNMFKNGTQLFSGKTF